jgi:hypothetical protein
MSKPGVALKTFGPTTENFGPTLSSAWNSKQLKPGRHSSHPPEPKMVQINMRRSSRSNSRVSSSAQQNLPRRSRKTPSPHLVLRRRWGRSLASAFIRAFSRRCPQAELSAHSDDKHRRVVANDDNPKVFFPEHIDASDGRSGVAFAVAYLVRSKVIN